MYDVAIIGAGVIGCLIGRELSKYELKTVIIEKENDVANGTTKANSAIIHAGYDSKYGTNKGRFNVEGNRMFDELCFKLDVPFKRIGSLVIAFEKEDMKTLKDLYENGQKVGVEGMEIIDGYKVLEMEPNLNPNILGALHAKSAGIIVPWELAIGAAENAMDNGVELLLNNQVESIENNGTYYEINTNLETIKAKYVINCAGVYSDKICSMVEDCDFEIIPRRGQYYLLDKECEGLVNRVIFQCPTKLGKGVLVAPTVDGNIIVGPDAEDIFNKDDISTTKDRLKFIEECAMKSCEKIPFHKTITMFAGLRAEPSTGDFIIEESKKNKGFINVAGIKSPGLSSAPAISVYVSKLLRDIIGSVKEKEDFNPMRKRVIRFMELTDEEKSETIKKDNRYGRIICRCESITEGEIVDCINRNAGATTLNGVKRRTRPGAGRCQGGFCGPRVIEILAREMGVDRKEILKENIGSHILTGHTKEL
ncbi:NAD(P)/FAD-dependent oxidoreductase [Anaeromicrobium sediminis]|uniref:FAD/NAD(P)-binding oxidoreductase n=1 Tax=Anaeromicrobium sediminis TaxID=1478221 RepID=A0A267MLY2_9FIRM|nr:NAD(P)/FAD-dependent oxidoreductase [Anaeromicrobium sediminis]PAB60614.1 FAD/NAD(P)-binding oxidoreductase [Anaeromicrobium sediminis]